MIEEKISLDEVIDFLNEILEVDRPAVAALVANRVPCNEDLANHPTVQVSAQNDGYYVGILGVLNGMFGTDEEGWGGITAVFDVDDKSYFNKLVRFERPKGKSILEVPV